MLCKSFAELDPPAARPVHQRQRQAFRVLLQGYEGKAACCSQACAGTCAGVFARAACLRQDEVCDS